MSQYLASAAAGVWNLLLLPLRANTNNPNQSNLATQSGASGQANDTTGGSTTTNNVFATPRNPTGKKRKTSTPLTNQSSFRKRIRGIDSSGNEIIRTIEFDSPKDSIDNSVDTSIDDSVDDSIDDSIDNSFYATDNENDVVVEEDYELPSPEVIRRERMRRQQQADVLKEQGWCNEDYTLFRNLTMRGLEPLLPKHWEMDFRALPEALFTDNERYVILNALGLDGTVGADFRATKALDTLFELGIKTRIRLMARTGKTAEDLITKGMVKYLRWSLVDAGIWKKRPYLPVLSIISGSKDVHADTLKEFMTEQLEQLRERWKTAQPLYIPPLYGVMSSHTVLAFVSLLPEDYDDYGSPRKEKVNNNGRDQSESSSGDAPPEEDKQKLRTIALFDFSKPDYDIWNAFAVAMLIVHCRDVLLKTLNDHPNGLQGVTLEIPEDPDA